MKRNLYKKLLRGVALGLALPLLLSASASPSASEKPILDGRVSMIARITEIGERITVEVTGSPYTFGVHVVHTPEETLYLDESGKPLPRTALSVGDVVRIDYSGQIMLSYPPQIVAARIRLIK